MTDAQYAAIAAGTFEDLYIGDYWVINNVTWRIAAFDYYYNTGSPICATHHVTLVPDKGLYLHVMNDTNTTAGGYVGSKMYTEGLTQAKTIINAAFGEAHILTHSLFLCNAVTNGNPTGRAWADSTVELMTEQNVYGCKALAGGSWGATIPINYEIDKSQYPLFAYNTSLISNSTWAWLRDTVGTAYFSSTGPEGYSNFNPASNRAYVRPAFSIID